MSLLDDASLIVTPNGYKGGVTTGTLYSVKPTNGDGDMVVTRNTTATRVNSAGVIESVAFNAPRIDYTNASCPSILVEPIRTNDALQSDGNLSTYSSLNVTNATSSFNSFNNAIQFPNTLLSYAYKSIVTTAQTYTISVFIKMDDNSVPILGSTSTTGNVSLVIGGSVATSNLKVESYGNNVYRLSATATSTGLNINNGVIRYDTQVLKSFKTTGIQLEAGSTATSYIPTTTIPITRNADVITKAGITNLIGQTEGTIFVDLNFTNVGVDKYILVINNTANTNSIAIRRLSGGAIRIILTATTTSGTTSQSSAVLANGNYKIAYRYISGSIKLYINGALSFSETPTFTFGAAIENIKLGMSNGNTEQLNDSINSFQLYQTALTHDQCIDLTN